MFFKEAAWPAW